MRHVISLLSSWGYMSKIQKLVFDEMEKEEREGYAYCHISYVIEPDEENMQPNYQKIKAEHEKETRELPF